jgi:uncharacterized protein YidB (DUF937 family)
MGISTIFSVDWPDSDGRSCRTAAHARRAGRRHEPALMALMPIVLQLLSNRGAGGSSGAGGGIADVLGQVLGGSSRGAAGGLGGLLEQLQRTGFGEQADSWVSRGANKPISPDAMTQVFGHEGLEQISRQAGISPEEASRGLSALLPEVVDRMTPDGTVPDADALAKSVDDFVRRLGPP